MRLSEQADRNEQVRTHLYDAAPHQMRQPQLCFLAKGGMFMLRKLGDHITKCLVHAAMARSRADETADPERKAEFLRLELSWTRLARSYEFVESLENFLLKPRTANAAVWHHRILEAYNLLMLEDPHEESGDKRTASLVRHGTYEVRLVELSRNVQEGAEYLWLELFDHDQKRTIDSYGGRTLVDVTAAAESLCSKAKELNQNPG